MDDLGLAARVDADRVELLQLVADGDDDVGPVEAEVDVVVAHEADRAERERMVVGEHALAVEGGRHRDVQRLGEPVSAALASARAAPWPASTTGLRAARRISAARSTCSADGSSGRGTLTRSGASADGAGGLLDVLGDRQVDGAGPLGLGELERLADHLRGRAGRGHQRRPLGHRREHRDQVDALVRLLVAAVHPDLGRERDQRRGVGGGVGDAEQQVDRPGPEGRRAHAGLAGQPAVDLGHERGALLVAGEHVVDRGLRQRLDQPDVLLAGDAEDVRDALVLQALDDQFGGGARLLGHEAKGNGARLGAVACEAVISLTQRAGRGVSSRR